MGMLRLRSRSPGAAGAASAHPGRRRCGAAATGLDGRWSPRLASSSGGLVQHREGRLSGWMLTPDGRARVPPGWPPSSTTDTSAAAAVADAYAAFLIVNQQRARRLHRLAAAHVEAETCPTTTPMATTTRVIAELDGSTTWLGRVCAELARVLDRFAGYGPRLAAALAARRAGRAPSG